MSAGKQLRILAPLYGGSFRTKDPAITLPFVAPEDLVEVSAEGQLLRVLEPAPERTEPQCLHFGTCGGCQYQMLTHRAQSDLKRTILTDLLTAANIPFPNDIPVHNAEPYGYRNRIRLRLQQVDGTFRVGYNIRNTTDFLPITMCPIAAPVLWSTAEAVLASTATSQDIARLFATTAEVELLCDHTTSRVLITLFCTPRTKLTELTLARLHTAIQSHLPPAIIVTGIGASAFDLRTGPTGRLIAATGASGLAYAVATSETDATPETYWIARSAFFQVNRFLLTKLAGLVCAGRSGALAFDLFAGAGLFSRVLARSFDRVVAVESNPAAVVELQTGLRRLAPQHTAVSSTTLDFLRSAIPQRDRPSLIVLDPPRAGAGVEACELLLQLAPAHLVYISCDPTTLARDLAVLTTAYTITTLQIVDLFPQTFHIETVVTLDRMAH